MVIIDRDRCTNCGSCIVSCSREVICRGESTPEINAAAQCMKCGHCCAACPVEAISFEGIPKEETYPEIPDAQLDRVIKMRRSTRNFKRETPDREIVEEAIRSAAWAPSAINCHSERWSVLWGYEKVARVIDMLHELAPKNQLANEMIEMLKARKGNPITLNAPCVIIAYGADDTYDPKLDCAIATTTLDLLLSGGGLSTCWGGYFARVLNGCPEIKEYAGIPEGSREYCTLAAGYADGETYCRPAYRPGPQVNWIS